MNKIKEVTLPLISMPENPRSDSECTLNYWKQPEASIAFHHLEIGDRTFSGYDLWECLLDLRKFLEDRGWLIVCNGARIDAYTSGMARSMSGGEKIYLANGETDRPTRTVNLFGTTDPEKISTVGKQMAYYRAWCALAPE